MKISYLYKLLVLVVILVGAFSCKRSDNSIYFYSESRDTIAPNIKTSVPLTNQIYNYIDDVHIVGNVTDLETMKTSGKLKSLSISVTQIDPTKNDSVIKTILTKTPLVDGKEGYTFNEKFSVPTQTYTSYFRLMITAFDYSGRSDKDSIFFSIK